MSIVVVCQKCQFWEFLKKWSLQVNSVTRQATFDRTKNCWKTPKLEKLKCNILGNCQHCEPWYLNMLSCLLRLKMRLFRDYNTLCFLLYSTTFISIEKHLKNKWHLPKKTNWEKKAFYINNIREKNKSFCSKIMWENELEICWFGCFWFLANHWHWWCMYYHDFVFEPVEQCGSELLTTFGTMKCNNFTQ